MKKVVLLTLIILALGSGFAFFYSCGGGGGGGDAVDLDMDGYDSSEDCDDNASSCTNDCVSDVDGDGIADCVDLCIDTDQDGYGDDNSSTIVGSGSDAVGSCTSDGVTLCIGGGSTCLGLDCDDDPATGYSVHTGATELCNDVDDDCNGQIDDGDPGSGVPCSTGLDGICDAGTTDCQSGFLDCVQNAYATTEICNGLDDNCDGETDEGFGTVDLDGDGYIGCADCNDTPGVGASIYPGATEMCNEVDDDCDNEVDEDFPLVNTVCTIGVGACQGQGIWACNSAEDGIECDAVAGMASTEVCNNVDDDCDGITNEGNPGGGVSCTTGEQGICSAGTTDCDSGALVCVQDAYATAEICNGLDDDCDGTPDDGASILLCPLTDYVVSTSCSSAQCEIVGCESGWFNCNTTYTDGCETDVSCP